MDALKLTVYYTGKMQACEVSAADQESPELLLDIPSPSDIAGVGGCFGEALEDFAEQLDDYIAKLVGFRNEIVRTSRAYTEAVKVDYNRNPLVKG